MPIPKPKAGEDQTDYIQRCMSNSTMRAEYPDEQQRLAVCYTTFREK